MGAETPAPADVTTTRVEISLTTAQGVASEAITFVWEKGVYAVFGVLGVFGVFRLGNYTCSYKG